MIGPHSPHKIPTLLAVVLLAGMSVLLAGINQATTLFSHASSESDLIENFLVSNVNDSGWTVSWTTPTLTSGVIYYGRDAKATDGVAVDERNVSAPTKAQHLHIVTVRGTRTGNYFFRLGVGSSKLGQANDTPYQVTLPGQTPQVSKAGTISGKVKDSSGNVVSGSLVVVKIAGAQPLSTFTKSDGTFSLPLNFVPTPGTEEVVSVIGETLEQSTINCQVGLEANLNNIRLGQGFNCTGSNSTSSGKSTTGSNQPTAATVSGGNKFKTVKINNGQKVLGTSTYRKVLGVQTLTSVVDPLPTISGEALPGQMVSLQVDTGTPIISVRTGVDGRWHWLPSSPLKEGIHTINISTTNKNGTKETETRRIIVSSALNVMPQVLGTPSAILAPPVVTPPVVSTPAARPQATPPATGTGNDTMLMLLAGILIFVGAGIVGFGKFGLN